jgi:putative endonuclease
MKYYVYILQCSDHTLYTGYTNNLKRRLKEHNESRGRHYTSGRGPVKLIYSEEFQTQREAMRRELKIKSWTREKKLALINSK